MNTYNNRGMYEWLEDTTRKARDFDELLTAINRQCEGDEGRILARARDGWLVFEQSTNEKRAFDSVFEAVQALIGRTP